MNTEGTPQRRDLRFTDLPQIRNDVQMLLSGYRSLRRWSLGQTCRHLAASFHGSIDGFDLRRHRVKRLLMAKLLLSYTYRWGIPEQYRVDPGIEPGEPVADEIGAEDLAGAIARYADHAGPFAPHPLFGRLSRDHWDRVHWIHCAHHLSFLVPSR